MKLNAVLFITIALTPVVGAAQHERRLEGCVDPRIIATLLARMPQTNSQPTSVEQLRSIWPTELSGVEDTKTHRTLESKDRILKGNCQCCTDFLFNLHQEVGVTREELYSVIVNYSARRRDTLVIMAKLFAKAAGLGKTDLRTVGNGSRQNYDWQTNKGSEIRADVIEIHFTHEAGLWKMHFSTAWYLVKRPEGAAAENPPPRQLKPATGPPTSLADIHLLYSRRRTKGSSKEVYSGNPHSGWHSALLKTTN